MTALPLNPFQVSANSIEIVIERLGMFLPRFSNFLHDRVLHAKLLKTLPGNRWWASKCRMLSGLIRKEAGIRTILAEQWSHVQKIPLWREVSHFSLHIALF